MGEVALYHHLETVMTSERLGAKMAYCTLDTPRGVVGS